MIHMSRVTSLILASTVFATCGSVAQAQCGYLGWRQVSATGLSNEAARHSFSMIYDSQQAKTILYGGASGRFPDYIELEDTRSLEGSTWVPLPQLQVAPKRWEFAMSYDSRRGVIVLNGGGSFVGVPGNPNNHHIGGTYEYDGATWAFKTMAGPNSRHGQGMAFDPVRDVTVLFGGKHDVLGTWEWNGNTWTDRTPGLGAIPQPRGFIGLAYHEGRGTTVLFGGGTNSFVPLGDTWEWNGTVWTQLSSAGQGPPSRLGPGMVYDSYRNIIVLHGGQDNVLGRRNDVWEMTGTTWALRTIAGAQPPVRYMGGFAYDRHRNRYIAAGGQTLGAGQSDTWELMGDPYVNTPPANISSGADADVTFNITITNSTPTTLRWRKDGTPLADSARIAGSATRSLMIRGVSANDQGMYDVVVTTGCGSFVTTAGVLTVACPADFNLDGGVDGADVDAFFGQWVDGADAADFNADGGVDGSDVDAFFDRWVGGC
jgi:hypothetical protein